MIGPWKVVINYKIQAFAIFDFSGNALKFDPDLLANKMSQAEMLVFLLQQQADHGD